MSGAASSYTKTTIGRRRPWTGDSLFLIHNLILKDIKVRFRNMSFGVLWSLLKPLVMMTVLWFVFTKIYPNRIPHFAAFVLCGIVPYNVFTICWLSGTTSIVESAGIVKRVPVDRAVIPLASVLGNCVHMSAQIALLLLLVLATGLGVNRYWVWLIVIWVLAIAFITGLSLLFSAFNVYVRDTRYVVESANVVLFWLVPIFYPFSIVPSQYHDIYQLNPVAALVLASLLQVPSCLPAVLGKHHSRSWSWRNSSSACSRGGTRFQGSPAHPRGPELIWT